MAVAAIFESPLGADPAVCDYAARIDGVMTDASITLNVGAAVLVSEATSLAAESAPALERLRQRIRF
jgi:hypothetical protein